MKKILEFFESERLQLMCEELNLSKYERTQDKLNVFTMSSDFYYRENYHSDVICAFLNPSYPHNEGTTFLFAFIDMINEFYGDKIHIEKRNYKQAVTEREQGRIDILVSSERSKHCIIIENKMNNAGDMARQLPRYFDLMDKQGYIIDAIVYIPLDVTKTPDTTTWTESDRNKIDPLLVKLPAYSTDAKKNLVDGWVLRCIPLTKNVDCISILSQYADLIKKLTRNIMDKTVLSELYDSLMKMNDASSAQTIFEMMCNLPEYMANRLIEKFQNRKDFCSKWKYKKNYSVLEFEYGKNKMAIDIVVTLNGYYVMAFSRNSEIDTILGDKCLKSLENFTLENGRYHNKDFKFNEEDKLVEWINSFRGEVALLEK